jgi:exopolysaccharide production protein ExoZ
MLPSIQALRAIAAYLVVMLHLSELVLIAGGPADIFLFGNSGVDLFFVISGLIMVFTTSRRETKPWEFFGSRLARVVPIYWLITIIVFAIALFAPSAFQATRADPIQLIKSLLFIPFPKSNGLVQPVVFVGWTLNYEMFFYAIFALSLFFPSRRVGLLVTLATLVALVALHESVGPDFVLARFFTGSLLLEFALGMTLGIILPYLPTVISARWIPLLIGSLALSALVWVRLIWPDLDRSIVFGVPAFFVVLCALILDRSGVGIQTRPIMMLGNASYSIYLSHFFVTQAAVKLAYKFGFHGVPALGALFFIALIGVAGVGLVVHLWVEKPLNRTAHTLLGLTSKALRPGFKSPVTSSASE